jgi:hypothetical protein
MEQLDAAAALLHQNHDHVRGAMKEKVDAELEALDPWMSAVSSCATPQAIADAKDRFMDAVKTSHDAFAPELHAELGKERWRYDSFPGARDFVKANVPPTALVVPGFPPQALSVPDAPRTSARGANTNVFPTYQTVMPNHAIGTYRAKLSEESDVDYARFLATDVYDKVLKQLWDEVPSLVTLPDDETVTPPEPTNATRRNYVRLQLSLATMIHRIRKDPDLTTNVRDGLVGQVEAIGDRLDRYVDNWFERQPAPAWMLKMGKPHRGFVAHRIDDYGQMRVNTRDNPGLFYDVDLSPLHPVPPGATSSRSILSPSEKALNRLEYATDPGGHVHRLLGRQRDRFPYRTADMATLSKTGNDIDAWLGSDDGWWAANSPDKKHVVALERRGARINYFDSNGSSPQRWTTYVRPDGQQETLEDGFARHGFNVTYSPVPLQDSGSCYAHVAMRIAHGHLDGRQFLQLIHSLRPPESGTEVSTETRMPKGKNGLTPDQFVSLWAARQLHNVPGVRELEGYGLRLLRGGDDEDDDGASDAGEADDTEARRMESQPFSDDDIRSRLPGSTVHVYNDLANATNLGDVVDGEGRLIVLYPVKSPTDGHWVCGIVRSGAQLDFNDSYGLAPDTEPNFVHEPERSELYGSGKPRELLDLLARSRVTATRNSTRLQHTGAGTETCGRHVVCRLAHKNMDDAAYNRLVTSRGDADAFVTDFTQPRRALGMEDGSGMLGAGLAACFARAEGARARPARSDEPHLINVTSGGVLHMLGNKRGATFLPELAIAARRGKVSMPDAMNRDATHWASLRAQERHAPDQHGKDGARLTRRLLWGDNDQRTPLDALKHAEWTTSSYAKEHFRHVPINVHTGGMLPRQEPAPDEGRARLEAAREAAAAAARARAVAAGNAARARNEAQAQAAREAAFAAAHGNTVQALEAREAAAAAAYARGNAARARADQPDEPRARLQAAREAAAAAARARAVAAGNAARARAAN